MTRGKFTRVTVRGAVFFFCFGKIFLFGFHSPGCAISIVLFEIRLSISILSIFLGVNNEESKMQFSNPNCNR